MLKESRIMSHLSFTTIKKEKNVKNGAVESTFNTLWCENGGGGSIMQGARYSSAGIGKLFCCIR